MAEPGADLKEDTPNDSTYNKKSPFGDPNATAEDRHAALDKILAEALIKQEEDTLSADNPDKVVKMWSPINESRAMKGFHYYLQRLDGKAPILNGMIGELKQGDAKEITGVIFEDDSIVWSDEAVVHNHLINAAKKHHTGIVGQFNTHYPAEPSSPLLHIYSDDEAGTNKFQNYLQRNISPETPLSVWVFPMSIKSKVKPHEISIKED